MDKKRVLNNYVRCPNKETRREREPLFAKEVESELG